MNVWLSPYELRPVLGRVRQGYLLKVQSPEGEPGYADIFPWVEFGDPSVEDIPNLIETNKSTPLLEQSFYFAKKDAVSRSGKKSLVNDLSLKNHFHLSGAPETWPLKLEGAFASGFRSVKLKVGRDLAAEVSGLLAIRKFEFDHPWLRLDFNGLGTKEYFDKIESLRPIIEFIEDPFLEPELWGAQDWIWAFDQPPFEMDKVDCKIQVIKPAKQNFKKIDSKTKKVFTSYLDHPVGIAHAFVEASSFGHQELDYGLMTQNQYEVTPFHDYLKQVGPYLEIEGSLGIGFDDLWDHLDWKFLC